MPTDHETPRDRRPYSKPSLTAHGEVKTLTTGGTGSAQESSQGQRPRP